MDSHVFAILQPTNLSAKVAFSKASEASRCQPPPLWSRCMHIEFVPEYNAEYAQQCEQNTVAGDLDSEASITEPDSDTEERRRDTYKLWRGCYVFKLTDRNLHFDPLWILGKGRPNHLTPDEGVQFKSNNSDLRGWHAKFFLGQTGFLAITPASRGARDITVGGEQISVGIAYHLNKGTFDVRIGPLLFAFSYTDHARSADFDELRTKVWTRSRDRGLMDANTAALNLTPMPSKNALSVGKYVVAKEIGRGGVGKVYSATDSTGTVFAIKVLERNKWTATSVAREIHVLEELTRAAEEADCHNIIRLKEVIGDYQSSTDNLLFKDIYFVFSTAAYGTIADVIHSEVPMKTRARYLRDILLGLKFLHDKNWVHRDIKDPNIGICQDHAVLLDMGSVKRLEPPSMSIAATPGYGGTVGFHAPETEMTDSFYGCAADIWAAGIVGYALFFHQHPLSFSRNPWRGENNDLRTMFHLRFHEMYEKLQRPDYAVPGVHNLLLQMLRFDQSQCNQGPRITAREALAHPVWDFLSQQQDSPRKKKSR